MESRKAVLSAPRTLDMVPLGEILQGRSNQGVKAYSDNSDRYISDSGILKGVFPPNWKKAWSSGEPTPAWSNDTFGQGVKYIQESPVTSAFECSLSNHQSINHSYSLCLLRVKPIEISVLKISQIVYARRTSSRRTRAATQTVSVEADSLVAFTACRA